MDEALQLTQIMTALGMVLGSLEFLRLKSYAKHGMLFALPTDADSNNHAPDLFVHAHSIRIFSAIPLIFEIGPITTLVALCCMVLTNTYLIWRIPRGLEGGDQLGHMTIVALLLSQLAQGNHLALTAAAIFLSSQLILSYLKAGTIKLSTIEWRNGDYLRSLAKSDIYGHDRIRDLAKLPAAPRIASWVILLFELLFPIALLLPTSFFLPFMLMGICFHLANAIFMGLNVFAFMTLAIYPCILSVHLWVSQFLWS